MIEAIRAWVASHWRGYLHGTAWKLAALACKFAFLIYFASRMQEGEFSIFLFWQSAALLTARAVSIGMADELPVWIRGQAQHVRQFWPLLRILQLIALIALGVAWALGNVVVAGITLFLVLSSGAILDGIVRTWQPNWYERGLNLPWLLFLAALLATDSVLAERMLLLYALSLFASQLLVSFFVRPGPALAEEESLAPIGVWSLIKHGSLKMVSEFTLVANMKAPIVLPGMIGGALQNDRVSFSLAVADALASVFMVIVNRNYVAYCDDKASPRTAVASASFIAITMFTVGLVSLAVSGRIPEIWPGQLSATDFVWACLFFGAITAYYEMRYYYWAHGTGAVRLIVFQVLVLASLAVVVVAVPVALSTPVMALVTAIAVFMLGVTLWLRGVGADRRRQVHTRGGEQEVQPDDRSS